MVESNTQDPVSARIIGQKPPNPLPGRKHSRTTKLLVVLAILLGVPLLSLGDLMEIIPLFAPVLASPLFPFFHEIHDLLAVGVVLYAAYHYSTRLAVIAILAYFVAHIPYAIVTFPEETPELSRILLGVFVAFLGIWLIDRLHQAEEETHTAAERYGSTLDSMMEGCQIIGFDWRYLYLNDAAVRQSRNTREALLVHTMMEIYPGIEQTEMFARLRRCLEERLPHRMENLFTYPDGSQGWFELSIEPMPGGAFILSLDITERKQAEEMLRQSEDKYRNIVENALVGVYRTNLKGDILYVNDTAVSMFGFDSAEEMIAGGVVARYKNQSNRAILIKELTEKGKVNNFEVELLTKTGERKNVIMNVILAGDTISGMVIDATERKRAEEALRQSEERFRAIFETTADGILIADTDSKRFFDGNKAICHLLGYTREEIKNLGIMDIHPEAELVSIMKRFTQLPEGNAALSLDIPVKRKDGSILYADINSAPITFAGKTYQLGIFRDATERKQAEESLRQSEALYRSLFENMLNGFAYCRMLFEGDRPLDWVYLSVNARFEELTGLHDVIGKKVTEVIPGIRETNPELFDIYGRVSQGGKPEVFETYLPPLDMWFSISVYSPSKEHFVAVFDVITERKRAEEQLRMAEQNFRNSLEESPLGIRIVTSEGELLYSNKTILDIYGYSSIEELRSMPTRERYTPESYLEHQQRRELRRLGQPVPPNYQISIVRKDGGIRDLSVTRKEVIWNGETQYQTIYQDITEHERADEQREQAAAEWQTTFDSIVDLISIHDRDFKIVRVNRAFANFLKMKPEEIIGRHCYEVLHGENEPSQYCAHIKTLETRKPSHAEFFNPHLGIYMEVDCSPIFNAQGEIATTVHIARDITERKKMEEQLVFTDRMASIGQLASGIAHELNNPLTGVIGFSDLLLERDVPEDVKEDLKVINREAKRTANIVKGLLTFARKQGTAKEPVDINSAIQGVLQLRSYEQKVSNIEVNTRLPADLPEVTGNRGQLQQVFINLIINAEQAMLEARGRGTLTVVTEQVGNIVRASVADDGPGISPENMRKLFTPFFTTKEMGKGTGLGLSICQGIVTEHGGRIYAESELGQGAAFIVELPIHGA